MPARLLPRSSHTCKAWTKACRLCRPLLFSHGTCSSGRRHWSTAAAGSGPAVCRVMCTATAPGSIPAGPQLTFGRRLTQAAHRFWQEAVQPGDLVVDATCGNGHDTLRLAQMVGPTGTVIAIDLQEAAMTATRYQMQPHLNAGALGELKLVQACHSTMQVCFNLGWLPQTDHHVITQPDTTLAAVRAAMTCVKVGGLISVMVYIGHEGGMAELDVVLQLVQGLPAEQWVAVRHTMPNRPTAPELFLLYRRE